MKVSLVESSADHFLSTLGCHQEIVSIAQIQANDFFKRYQLENLWKQSDKTVIGKTTAAADNFSLDATTGLGLTSGSPS